MLYMGVDRAHRGLGKALLGAIVEELKKSAEQIATTDINMMAIRNMINRG